MSDTAKLPKTLVLGGANIDNYQDPQDPNTYLPPKLGGDAANTAVRLALAPQQGWSAGDVTLAALVGMQGKEGLPGGQFILDQLTAAGVKHDAGFCHDGLVRNAVWRYKTPLGRHVLDQTPSEMGPNFSYLADPIERILDIQGYPEMPNGGIVLAASMPTTLAWMAYCSYATLPIQTSNAILISSPNTREIKPDETFEYLGEKFDKRKYYDKQLVEQLMISDIVVVSQDDLPHIYPSIEPEKRFDCLKEDVFGFGVNVLIFSHGEEGLEIHLNREDGPIESMIIPAPVIHDAKITVGAGGAALTGLVLGLRQLGLTHFYKLPKATREQWETIGQTMVAFSAYHILDLQKRNPNFPRPETVSRYSEVALTHTL